MHAWGAQHAVQPAGGQNTRLSWHARQPVLCIPDHNPQLRQHMHVQGVLSTQYGLWEGRLACQARSGLTAIIFRKALLVSSCHLRWP